MAWFWKPSGSTDDSVGLERLFGTQGEAESWLGEFYPDLVKTGVVAVSLYEEDRLVYGPMRLTSES
ncbi:MAG TPA: hypothetical protein VFP89_03605 [Propionibacteriaceae bacterium]|nr:hypothetical protein [Propionibacteriaceae bacterium]